MEVYVEIASKIITGLVVILYTVGYFAGIVKYFKEKIKEKKPKFSPSGEDIWD